MTSSAEVGSSEPGGMNEFAINWTDVLVPAN